MCQHKGAAKMGGVPSASFKPITTNVASGGKTKRTNPPNRVPREAKPILADRGRNMLEALAS